MNIRPAFRLFRFLLGLMLLFTLMAGNVGVASAALRCYVKANAAGSNNGSSWVNAYKSLQSALGGSACTEVWVAKGVYKPTTGTNRTISFQLKNGVSIYGGFAGNETLLGQRNPSFNVTTLSGEIGIPGNEDNSYHVVNGTGTNSSALLDGFTVMGGNPDGSGGWPHYVGGGVLNNGGSPRLVNLIIKFNVSADNGAGMYNFQSSPILINVAFLSNETAPDNTGGGMQNDDGSNPILINVSFIGNVATSGGGMANAVSSPVLRNVTFYNNSVTNAGGAIYNHFSSPSLTNVTISGNGAGTIGGGIYNENNSGGSIKNSIVYGNGGGEIVNDASNPIVNYSIVQGGYPGTGNLNADPLLKPLGNYGGFTQTRPLGAGSPAIDAGHNTGCPPKDQRGIPRPQDGDGNGSQVCDMGATESLIATESYSSTGAQDGWVLESAEASGVGGSMNAIQSTIAVGDDVSDKQGISILSFNTASLPNSVVILSARLQVQFQEAVGVNPFTTHGKLLVDVRKGSFSNDPDLQLEDFQAAANKSAVMSIPNSPVNGWYSKTIPAASLIYINKKGLTQFRLRFALEDDNDNLADYVKFFSGDSATDGSRPKLIIKYYKP